MSSQRCVTSAIGVGAGPRPLALSPHPQIVRSLGYAPTKSELDAYCAVIQDTYGGRLSFDNFTMVMVTMVVPQQAAKPDPADGVRTAFKHFGEVCREGDNGTVSMKDLEYLMTQRGEQLNEAEFRHMQRAAKPTYSRVQYERLLQSLSSEAATAGAPSSVGSPLPRQGTPGTAAGL